MKTLSIATYLQVVISWKHLCQFIVEPLCKAIYARTSTDYKHIVHQLTANIDIALSRRCINQFLKCVFVFIDRECLQVRRDPAMGALNQLPALIGFGERKSGSAPVHNRSEQVTSCPSGSSLGGM